MFRRNARRISGKDSAKTWRFRNWSLNSDQYGELTAAYTSRPRTTSVLAVAIRTPLAPSSFSENPRRIREGRRVAGGSSPARSSGRVTEVRGGGSLRPDRDLADVRLLREPLVGDRLQRPVALHLLQGEVDTRRQGAALCLDRPEVLAALDRVVRELGEDGAVLHLLHVRVGHV